MSSSRWPRFAARTVAVAATALVAAGGLPAASQAAVMTFGSPLSAPSSEDTAVNLSYTGTTFAYGTGTIHINHDGADTAMWNATLASGSAAAPAAGQITSVTLEGCAEQANGGPAPLTQIHFQALTPQAGGGMLIDVTTQPFNIPVCGVAGASAATQTSYSPTNFCVDQGDYIAFNDEGGFDSTYYPSGVPYEVLGAVGGSTTDSFIADNGTNNGTTMSPSVVAPSNGFASNPGEELMLQATVATGSDATPLCPGGTAGEPPPAPAVPQAGQPGGPPAVSIPHPQHEGVTHSRTVRLSLYCAQALPCNGTVSLNSDLPASAASGPRDQAFGTAAVNVLGRSSAHVSMTVSAATLNLLRKHRGGVPAMMTVTLSNGQRISQVITLLL